MYQFQCTVIFSQLKEHNRAITTLSSSFFLFFPQTCKRVISTTFKTSYIAGTSCYICQQQIRLPSTVTCLREHLSNISFYYSSSYARYTSFLQFFLKWWKCLLTTDPFALPASEHFFCSRVHCLIRDTVFGNKLGIKIEVWNQHDWSL